MQHTDEVITADRNNLHRESEFVALLRGVGILRNNLLGGFEVDRNDGFEEADKGFGLVPVRKEKIDSILDLLDVEGIAMGVVLEDQLL